MGRRQRLIEAHSAEVSSTVDSVPLMSTRGPRQRGSEGVSQKIQAPHQHHDVVGVAEEHDHH